MARRFPFFSYGERLFPFAPSSRFASRASSPASVGPSRRQRPSFPRRCHVCPSVRPDSEGRGPNNALQRTAGWRPALIGCLSSPPSLSLEPLGPESLPALFPEGETVPVLPSSRVFPFALPARPSFRSVCSGAQPCPAAAHVIRTPPESRLVPVLPLCRRGPNHALQPPSGCRFCALSMAFSSCVSSPTFAELESPVGVSDASPVAFLRFHFMTDSYRSLTASHGRFKGGHGSSLFLRLRHTASPSPSIRRTNNAHLQRARQVMAVGVFSVSKP